METARLLLPGAEVQPVDELYFGRPGFRTAAMLEADGRLGYAPIEQYPLHEYQPGAQEMVAALGRAAERFVPGDVLVVGHAGYLSFLSLELIEALAPTDSHTRAAWVRAARSAVLPVSVGEVSGFEMSAGGGVTHLPNPTGTDFGCAPTNDSFVSESAA